MGVSLKSCTVAARPALMRMQMEVPSSLESHLTLACSKNCFHPGINLGLV
jgi:hypothetical protein